MIIQDQNGTDIKVNLKEIGGMVDCIIRANTEADWIFGALHYGFVYEDNGEIIPKNGIDISIIGSVEISPAEYDSDGNVITQAVIDNRYHVNLRLSGPALTMHRKIELIPAEYDSDGVEIKSATYEYSPIAQWKEMALAWTNYGVEDDNNNKEEKAVVFENVALIDPESIKTFSRVWA